MTRYQTSQFTAEDAAALAGQRADITTAAVPLAHSYRPGKTYENAIVVRAEGDTLVLADRGEYGGYEQVSVPLADVRAVACVRPIIEQVKVLHGHDSPETAFLQDDYPYGRYRAERRVWIDGPAEKGAAKGQVRWMAQTADPKRTGPGRPGKYGQGTVSPGGCPWNAPKPSTYHDWMVLYLNEEEHVHYHSGSFLEGMSGAADARMRLDGTYAQLDEEQLKRYNLALKIGQKRDEYKWAPWRAALEFIAGYRDENGVLPGPKEVADAPGFHLSDYSYPVAVAAVVAGLEVPVAA